MNPTQSILETVSPGRIWRVVVIESGVSQNGNYWSPEILKQEAHQFEGVWVYNDHDSDKDRQDYPVRRIADRVGILENVSPVETENGGVRLEADFKVIRQSLRDDMMNALEMGVPSFIQFSVNALGRDVAATVDGRRVRKIESVEHVRSVDAVTEGAAGGRLIRLVASKDGDMPDLSLDDLKQLVAEAIAAEARSAEDEMEPDMPEDDEFQGDAGAPDVDPGLPGAAPVAEAGPPPGMDDEMDDEDIEEFEEGEAYTDEEIEEMMGAEDDDDEEVLTESVKVLRREVSRMRRERRRERDEARIREAVSVASLPPVAARRVAKLLSTQAGSGRLSDRAIVEAIKDERRYLASFSNAAPVAAGSVRMPATLKTRTPGRREMHAARLKAMFDRRALFEAKDGYKYDAFRSLREAWYDWNGGDPFSGSTPFDIMRGLRTNYDSQADHRRFTESIHTADWGQIVADVMYQVLIKAYTELPYDDWKKIVSDIEPVADFRTRHWMAVGGYGDLSTVGEGAAYPVLTSPGDEEETYAIAKRGGLEASITLEMVANDQVGALSRIPDALARAAKRTLYKFVMDLVTTTNGTMGDGVTLYHANHNNTGTTALSVSGLQATQRAMRDQTARLESSEILGPRNKIKYLIVPNELEHLAERIINPSAAYAYGLTPAATTPGANIDTDGNLDPHAFANKGIEAIVYDYLTDANDWWAIADPKEIPTVTVGFFGGRQEPELFVQDDPTVGQGFNNDTQAIKIRHIYGATPVEYRSMYRQVVT